MARSRITLLALAALLLSPASQADWNKRASSIKAPTAQTAEQTQATRNSNRIVQARQRPAPDCLRVITPTPDDKPTWACP